MEPVSAAHSRQGHDFIKENWLKEFFLFELSLLYKDILFDKFYFIISDLSRNEEEICIDREI